MDLEEVNRQVLKKAKDVLFEEVTPDLGLVSFLGSERFKILDVNQQTQLLVIPQKSQRKEKLFEILSTTPDATNALIDYFGNKELGKLHISEILTQLKRQAIEKQTKRQRTTSANIDPANLLKPEDVYSGEARRISFTGLKIRPLVEVIGTEPLVVEQWSKFIPKFVKEEKKSQELEQMLEDTPVETVMRRTLQHFLNQRKESATLQDLIQIFQDAQLVGLVGIS